MIQTDTRWFNILGYIINFPSYHAYQKVLWHLYQVEFWYDTIELDANRIQDAIDLRYRYGVNVQHDISVLEVMAALVERCDTSFLYNPKIGSRTGFWFEQMLISLGLDAYPDWKYNEGAVNDILDAFLRRQYAPNGKRGLFTLRHPREDLTRIDIWMQAMWWFDEYEKDCDKAEEYYGEEE